MERILTPEEVAKRLQVTERTVLQWLRDGKLPGAKLGRLWRVKESDLHEFLDYSWAIAKLEELRRERPEIRWVEGRCEECGRPLPVPNAKEPWVCGSSCLQSWKRKLYAVIGDDPEAEAGTRVPQVVPYWLTAPRAAGTQDEEALSAEDAAESESAWREYLEGRDKGQLLEVVRREVLEESENRG